MKRFLGLDYGDANIGVAVSCPRGIVATGAGTIKRGDPAAMKPVIARVRELIALYGITCVVLGYPRHMDGNTSARCLKTEDFAERLRRNFKRLTVEFWDERLSTQAVKPYSKNVDEMAAVYILQGYLDHKNNEQWEECKMDEQEQLLMVDENGNEQPFDILASKESGGVVYLLAAEAPQTESGEDEAEIVHFKCVATEGEDMIFELVEDDHEDFELVMNLFKDDYEALDIIIEE
ncbi:MAG: Holliday junction resolvase RuvX [Defluviitaleaceae bacterium]|nr:Holliday junction resolvase RuvX [Defluviitaleaceae bacterium]